MKEKTSWVSMVTLTATLRSPSDGFALTHSIYRMCAVFEALQDILWQALILLLKRKVVNVTANHFKLASIFLEKKLDDSIVNLEWS